MFRFIINEPESQSDIYVGPADVNEAQCKRPKNERAGSSNLITAERGAVGLCAGFFFLNAAHVAQKSNNSDVRV